MLNNLKRMTRRNLKKQNDIHNELILGYVAVYKKDKSNWREAAKEKLANTLEKGMNNLNAEVALAEVMKEAVDHPSHYNEGKYEVIDVIEDWDLDFNLGNAVKYIARAKYKNGQKEDLKKALWYLQRAINRLED